ncbi:hypothetical protein ACF1DV_07125 [Streptomyces achromogenes]|uniref:hypothetical protein n=1 Tax=Streptomyces achromogenes TaxID=67255 RepID=UPI0036FF1E4A
MVLRTLGADHVVQAGGNVTLPLLIGVLVDSAAFPEDCPARTTVSLKVAWNGERCPLSPK